ncbi:membrane protein, partial [Streptomyces sp. NRRL WC-3753]
TRPIAGFNRIRLSLGRFLALGLEFQLAGDVLRTAIAPSFDQIGQLAAIAAIRTGLNFFLGREIEAERREVERLSAHDRGGATAPAP